LDFADIRRFPPGSHGGVVVFRLRDQRWKTLKRPLGTLLKDSKFSNLEKGLVIVEESRVRYKRHRK
jgi:hypothetical protein